MSAERGMQKSAKKKEDAIEMNSEINNVSVFDSVIMPV